MNRIAYLLAALGVATSTPAFAYTLSDDYFEQEGYGNCLSGDYCAVEFPQLPAALTGKFLTVTEVSCFVRATQPLNYVQLAITDAGSNVRRERNLNGNRFSGSFSFNQQVRLKVAGGPPRQLRIYLGTNVNSSTSGDCTIVGTVTNQ